MGALSVATSKRYTSCASLSSSLRGVGSLAEFVQLRDEQRGRTGHVHLDCARVVRIECVYQHRCVVADRRFEAGRAPRRVIAMRRNSAAATATRPGQLFRNHQIHWDAV